MNQDGWTPLGFNPLVQMYLDISEVILIPHLPNSLNMCIKTKWAAQPRDIQFSSAQLSSPQFSLLTSAMRKLILQLKKKKNRKFIQDTRAAPKHLLQSKNYELGYVVLAGNNAILR